MKIAQIVCVFLPYRGGMGGSVYNFAKILSDYGHEVVVFTPQYNRDLKQEEEKGGFKIIRLKPLLKHGNGAFLPQLLWKLKGFDIVHLHYPFFGGAEIVWLAKALYSKKIRLVVHYHMDTTGLPWLSNILSRPAKIFLKPLFKRAEAITCASIDYIKHSSVKELYEKHSNKFYEVPFGVEIDKFVPRKERTPTIKGSDPLEILFVGGLDKAHYFKGLNVLFKALAKLKNFNYKLRIIGSGDLRVEYEKFSEKLGLKGKVEFNSGVDNNQLIKYYQAADLFILPSINKNEAFGLVLLEAMACGLPIIASNLPGVRCVFYDGIQGLLTKPNNVNDLTGKLKMLLTDNEMRKSMGLAGRKLVEDKYSWVKAGEKLNKIYNENLLNK